MPIPIHTFEPTGEPVVDDLNFFLDGPQGVTLRGWFGSHPRVLAYTPDQIISDAEPYQLMDGPEGCGIYVLLKGDHIAYVGKALAVWDRLRSHYLSGKDFDKYWCFGGVPYSWLTHVEGYYIKRLKPYLNKMNVISNPVLDQIAQQTARVCW